MYIRHPEVLSSLCIRHYLIPTYVNLNPHMRRSDVTAPFTSIFSLYEVEYRKIHIIVRKLVIGNRMILDCTVTIHTEGPV